MSTFLSVSREILEQGRSVRFKASGWSMHPVIQNGDFIIACPVKDCSIKKGDIVFYTVGDNRALVHRIIGLRRSNGEMIALIKGDACFGPSDKIPVQNILGRVVAFERNGQEKRLNTKPYRIIGLFFAVISPFSRWIFHIGGRVKYKGRRVLSFILETLQSPRFYSLFVRKLMKGNIHYQIAAPDNAFSLSRLYRFKQWPELENPTDSLYEQLKNPEDFTYWLVAMQKNRVVAGVNLTRFLESDYPYEGWWLTGMKVNWRYRRMRIGEKLTMTAADLAAKHCASEIKLLVFEDAKPASNLYRKLGFRQISIPELDEQLEEEAKRSSHRRIILAKPVES